MAREPSPEIDDELFSEIYGKEYTGPPRVTSNTQDNAKGNKRPDGSDEEEEHPDPNAVPTDFTSREAKVWVAKTKATERNWKKRKEEEMICKICGESGHFTQGCPSTLGANRKSQDFFERVPAREKHVKALFTDKVIQRIEKDVGCKIKMEEKFIIVSGKDRVVLGKGVDAVRKVISDEDKNKSLGSSSSYRNRSRSPDRSDRKRSRTPDRRSPFNSHGRSSEPQRSHSSPRRFQPKNPRLEKASEDHLRDNIRQRMPRASSQAYDNDGAKGHHPSHSKSPRPNFAADGYNSYSNHPQNIGPHKTDSWGNENRETDAYSVSKYEFPSYPQTLEELELEFKREAMEFGRIRDKEEDEENYKHREKTRELREAYMKNLAILRGMQAKQWEEFLQQDLQRRQRHQISASAYNSYNHLAYSNYEQPSHNTHYPGSNMPMDPRFRQPIMPDNYPKSGSHIPTNPYTEFQPQRREEFDRTYNRY